MNDFFKAVYDHALENNTLNHKNNPKYRAANTCLNDLLDDLKLDADTQEQILGLVYDLLYCSDVDTLTYGFRLAAQVIKPVVPVRPAHV